MSVMGFEDRILLEKDDRSEFKEQINWQKPFNFISLLKIRREANKKRNKTKEKDEYEKESRSPVPGRYLVLEPPYR